ncbi:MAG: hypothetical protein N838_24335, partial [Thiohalocapsa sp. PB-PSB1]
VDEWILLMKDRGQPLPKPTSGRDFAEQLAKIA